MLEELEQEKQQKLSKKRDGSCRQSGNQSRLPDQPENRPDGQTSNSSVHSKQQSTTQVIT